MNVLPELAAAEHNQHPVAVHQRPEAGDEAGPRLVSRVVSAIRSGRRTVATGAAPSRQLSACCDLTACSEST
jgi:hypothetical protein